jgi:DNA-binding PadR family transcriptional regulator
MSFGFGPWPGEGRGRRGGPRVRRGDVRAAALALLGEEPRNGYQLIQEIAERSGGVWQPSPGSVYPALQQLEDEGLIQAETPEGGRKRYALTAEGREYVTAHADEVRAPWDDVASSVGTDAIELRRLIAAVAMAAMQVAQVGTTAQVAQSQQILVDARRKLYAILAADDDDAQ